MKTLYFYIGLPTTSESSLQFFLLKNRKALSAAGIGTPNTKSTLSHAFIDHVVYNEENALPTTTSLISEDDYDESPRLNQDRQFQRIELLKECVDKHDKIVMVDTKPFFHANNQNALNNLKRTLQSILNIDDIKLVIFLRRQDRYLHSLYIQRILSGNEHRQLNEYAEDIHNLKYLDYNNLLLNIEHVFTKENVILKIYDEDNENIPNSFFKAIKLNLPDTIKPVLTKLNTNISSVECEAKRMLNMMTKSCNLMFLNSEISHRSKLYTAMSSAPYRSFLPEENLKAMIRFYRKGNTEIANRYFEKDDLFDMKDMNDMKYDLLPSSDDIMRAMSHMLKQTNKRYG